MSEETKNYFAGNWKILKGKVKETWGDLTDDAIDQVEGRYEALIGELQKEYKISEEQAKADISSFVNRHKV